MQQISKIQKICQDKRLGRQLSCGLDRIVQLRRETWCSDRMYVKKEHMLTSRAFLRKLDFGTRWLKKGAMKRAAQWHHTTVLACLYGCQVPKHTHNQAPMPRPTPDES